MTEALGGDGVLLAAPTSAAMPDYAPGLSGLTFNGGDLTAQLSNLAQQYGLIPSICRRPTEPERQLLMARAMSWDNVRKHRGLPKGMVAGLASGGTSPVEGAGPRVKANKAKQNAAGRQYTSRYRGVHQTFPTRRWEAQFRRAGKPTSLGCFNREDDAARAYDKMMLWCEIHQAGGVKGGITNFELSEYEKDFKWLTEITQDELIEALRSEGRHQAQYRNLQRARRDGSHSAPQSDDDMGGYGGGYDRPLPKRRRSSNSQRGGVGQGAGGGGGVGGLLGMEALYGAAVAGAAEHGAMLSELMGIPGYGGMGLAQLQMLSQAHAAAAAGMDPSSMGLAQLLPAMDMSGLAAMADGVAAAAAGDGGGQQQMQQGEMGAGAGYGYTAQQLQSMGQAQEAYQQLAAAGGMGDMQAALASAAAAAAAAASANAAGSVGMEALAAASAPMGQLMMGLGQQQAGGDGGLPVAVLPPVADLDISGTGAGQGAGDGAAGGGAGGSDGGLPVANGS